MVDYVGYPIVVVPDNSATVIVAEAFGLKGDKGDPGSTGGDWLYGTGAPAGSLGADNNIYYDQQTGNVYKKVAGAWALQFTIQASGVAWGNITGKPNLSFTYDFNDSRNIVINHNMGKKPAIKVLDSAGSQWYTDTVVYTDLNNLVISFRPLFTGQVILS